ncbi:MAG: ABC transporter ATP-binding protein [Acidimicrobiia bacterium]|nr:ABC transporter ATP-binding protein [Acidimicrobiia bacterium]
MTKIIEAAEVSKVFEGARGRVVALEDISVSVERGEIMAFLGPSGCGKSTLLDILAGLTAPTTGSVLIESEPPRPRQEIGLMFQKSLLFPWRNVLDNVLLPADVLGLDKEVATERAAELLDLVGLGGWGGHRPSELSGGMQQRVALARVLLPDPDVLLLDEPFGALDEMTRESLDLELARIARLTHKTVIFVTHNVYEAVLISDKICVFTPRPGRVAGIVEVPIERPRSVESLKHDTFSRKVQEVRDMITTVG